jgi:hypothetical protein
MGVLISTSWIPPSQRIRYPLKRVNSTSYQRLRGFLPEGLEDTRPQITRLSFTLARGQVSSNP